MSVIYRLIAAHELDAALVAAWRSIQGRNDAFSSPYFCPEFTQAVGQVRDDVRIVVIEDAGCPVGFFPHQRSSLGMGKPVGGPMSDFHGVVATSDAEWDLRALMRAAKLSVWAFDHLVGNVGKFEPYVTAHATSPHIDIGSGYERFAQQTREGGSDYIKKTEGLARKLGRDVGPLRFTLHEMGSGAMEQLIDWKRDQYRTAGTLDVFRVSWTRDLLDRIAHIQTAEFAGVCSALRVGDKILAVHMGMRSREVFHYWFPGYAPEFAKFSSGIILLLRLAEALSNDGVRTIDLGKGDSQYKQRLMSGGVELREGAVEMPSLLSSARQLQRTTEARAAQGGVAAALRLPLKVIRRLEWTRKFR